MKTLPGLTRSGGSTARLLRAPSAASLCAENRSNSVSRRGANCNNSNAQQCHSTNRESSRKAHIDSDNAGMQCNTSNTHCQPLSREPSHKTRCNSITTGAQLTSQTDPGLGRPEPSKTPSTALTAHYNAGEPLSSARSGTTNASFIGSNAADDDSCSSSWVSGSGAMTSSSHPAPAAATHNIIQIQQTSHLQEAASHKGEFAATAAVYSNIDSAAACRKPQDSSDQVSGSQEQSALAPLTARTDGGAQKPDWYVSPHGRWRGSGRGPRGIALLASQFYQAARCGDPAKTRGCLEAGAEINGCDEHGWAALHYAVAGGHASACEVLIEFGANLEIKLPDLSTPLMLAADDGNLLIARLLLCRGALPGWRDEDGFSALDRCDASIRDELAKCILECRSVNGT